MKVDNSNLIKKKVKRKIILLTSFFEPEILGLMVIF